MARWARGSVLVGLLLGIGLAASGVWRAAPDRARTESLGVAGPAPTIAQTAQPAALTPTLPAPAEALLLVQGLTAHRLVLWPLDGGAPVEIDRGVSARPLIVSPEGQRVIYGTQGAALVLDVPAHRAAIVGSFAGGGQLITAQWSPDGRQVAYVVQQGAGLIAYLARADGTADARIMGTTSAGLDLDIAWTGQGDPVLLTLGVGPSGGLARIAQRFDPISGALIVLPDTTPLLQLWDPRRAPDGAAQVFALRSWDEARYHGRCGSGPLGLVGTEWLPVALRMLSPQLSIAFEVEGLYFDQPTWLADGRIVFRAVADTVCTAQRSGVYMARLGETPAPIVEAEPDYVADDADKPLWVTSYALSPDQSRLAWTEHAVGAHYATVYARALAGDPAANPVETLLVITPAPDPDPFAYRDDHLVLQMVWLAADPR